MRIFLTILLLSPLPLMGDVQSVNMSLEPVQNERIFAQVNRPPYRAGQVPNETVKEMIIRLADKYGVNREVALKIAWCESKFDPLAKNPNSSAKGVYQYIDSTYSYIGGKDVFDPEENIRLFMEWYPKRSYWWECT